MPLIELQGQAIAYSVRQSRRAKRVSLRLSAERGLELVYPAGKRHPPPEAVLREQANWIIRAMRRAEAAAANAFRRHYEPGEEFLVRGQAYRLMLREESAPGRAAAALNGDRLELWLGACPKDSDRELRRAAVISFYRGLAQDYLPGRLDALASELGLPYRQLRIKNQKTRWGSCSAKRNINLNLRLMMTPDAAIDYVIIHELCHLRHLNHSPAFWRLVGSRCPDYQLWRAWLRRNQARLIL